ncbi:hypothetical protein HZ994_06635 [Akkermansiaceae bacterium]|nr:hypothetical protein HZ994_06635 [Akkermansiaceae bacterium]
MSLRAVNPADGQLVPHNDTEACLDTMPKEVPDEDGKRVVLVLDNTN